MSSFSLCIRCLRQTTPKVQAAPSLRSLHTPAILKSRPVSSSTSSHTSKPTQASQATLSPTPSYLEKYTVQRTPTRNLPIYQLAKAGGNLKLTKVRKLGGDTEALRKELEGFLEPKPEYVKINGLTGHIMIKGWYREQISNFLQAKGF